MTISILSETSFTDVTPFTDTTSVSGVAVERANGEYHRARRRADYDLPEIAIGFGQANDYRHAARTARAATEEFQPATISGMTFRRSDPLREPLQVADVRLQDHLEALCEQLRAKY